MHQPTDENTEENPDELGIDIERTQIREIVDDPKSRVYRELTGAVDGAGARDNFDAEAHLRTVFEEVSVSAVAPAAGFEENDVEVLQDLRRTLVAGGSRLVSAVAATVGQVDFPPVVPTAERLRDLALGGVDAGPVPQTHEMVATEISVSFRRPLDRLCAFSISRETEVADLDALVKRALGFVSFVAEMITAIDVRLDAIHRAEA